MRTLRQRSPNSPESKVARRAVVAPKSQAPRNSRQVHRPNSPASTDNLVREPEAARNPVTLAVVRWLASRWRHRQAQRPQSRLEPAAAVAAAEHKLL